MIADELGRLGARVLLDDLLDAEATATPEVVRLDNEKSTALFELCLYNRLAPALGEAVRKGTIGVSEDVAVRLTDAVAQILASQLRVEQKALVVIDALAGADVEFRVLKGMATAHLDYPNPALRPTGDLDLLVRSTDMPAAMAALRGLRSDGFRALRGDDWRLHHAVPFELDGIEVDLHHRLLHQAAGHCAARFDLFVDSEEYELGGRLVFALPAWLRLVQAASQNVIGGSRQLTSDLDVVRLSEYVPPARERCREVGLGWVFDEGVRRSASTFGRPTFRAPAWRRGWKDRLFEREYGAKASSILRRTAFEIAVAPPSLGLALARSAVLPGADYLERRGRSPRDQLARQIARLRSAVGWSTRA